MVPTYDKVHEGRVPFLRAQLLCDGRVRSQEVLPKLSGPGHDELIRLVANLEREARRGQHVLLIRLRFGRGSLLSGAAGAGLRNTRARTPTAGRGGERGVWPCTERNERVGVHPVRGIKRGYHCSHIIRGVEVPEHKLGVQRAVRVWGCERLVDNAVQERNDPWFGLRRG